VLRLDTPVTRIETDPHTRRATAVHTAAGDRIDADAVVSNADVASTYLHRVDRRIRRHNTDRRIRGLHYSMSLFVLYFGTDRRHEDIATPSSGTSRSGTCPDYRVTSSPSGSLTRGISATHSAATSGARSRCNRS